MPRYKPKIPEMLETLFLMLSMAFLIWIIYILVVSNFVP